MWAFLGIFETQKNIFTIVSNQKVPLNAIWKFLKPLNIMPNLVQA